MVIFFSALQAIPQEIYEAGRLDGLSEVGIALRLKLPLIRPALLLGVLFALIGTLQLFNEPKFSPASRTRLRRPTRPTSWRTTSPSCRRTTTMAAQSRSFSARSPSSSRWLHAPHAQTVWRPLNGKRFAQAEAASLPAESALARGDWHARVLGEGYRRLCVSDCADAVFSHAALLAGGCVHQG